MKKFLALALGIIMLLGAVSAYADPFLPDDMGEGEADDRAVLTINVMDAEGNPLPSADVVIKDARGEIVESYTTDDTGTRAFEGLTSDALYIVRATDPADGYSAQQRALLEGATEVNLVIRKLQVGSQLTIGTLTGVTGRFFSDLWSNNTSDLDVRSLIHGMSTVIWNSDLQYGIDETAIEKITVQEDAEEKVYTFKLYDDLYFSDGSRLTARDYVFSVLLLSSPQLRALGAQGEPYKQLLGYDAFASGERDAFSGVRLIDEYTFSLHIDPDYLPYFYELMYVNVTPYPISVIAPGMTVEDEGHGARLVPLTDERGNPIGAFTTEVLEETIMDPQTGYMVHPSVTSGAYQMTGYDEESGTVSFTVNPHYKGNYEGRKPVIEQITLKKTTYDAALDELASGDLNIVNKVSAGEVIDLATERVRSAELQSASYLRAGYGFINFACEQGPTQYEKVRQAIAMAFDQEGFVTDFLGSYGMKVYSHYGLGQWMVQDFVNTMQDVTSQYPYDLEAAKQLLVEDGWTLNAQGEEFREGLDAVRYKRVPEEEMGADDQGEAAPGLMALHVDYAEATNNTGARMAGEMLSTVLTGLGFEVDIHEIPYEQLLRHYYREDERTYELMFLATNFTFVYDPYYSFLGDQEHQGIINTSGIDDARLSQIALEMRTTASGDTEPFVAKWLELMGRYSEILPTLPLYSNVYFDFFDTTVQEYKPSAHWSWPAAILYTYIGEAPAPGDQGGDSLFVD